MTKTMRVRMIICMKWKTWVWSFCSEHFGSKYQFVCFFSQDNMNFFQATSESGDDESEDNSNSDEEDEEEEEDYEKVHRMKRTFSEVILKKFKSWIWNHFSFFFSFFLFFCGLHVSSWNRWVCQAPMRTTTVCARKGEAGSAQRWLLQVLCLTSNSMVCFSKCCQFVFDDVQSESDDQSNVGQAKKRRLRNCVCCHTHTHTHKILHIREIENENVSARSVWIIFHPTLHWSSKVEIL